MQIRWKSMYFPCPTSLINTVFLSLIHIVKDILFILQMSYFIKYLVVFNLGPIYVKYTMTTLCISVICVVVSD